MWIRDPHSGADCVVVKRDQELACTWNAALPQFTIEIAECELWEATLSAICAQFAFNRASHIDLECNLVHDQQAE